VVGIGGTEQLARTLLDLAFELDEPTSDGLSHRFRRREVVIDLLAPEGLGDRTPLTTVPPAHTLMVQGGSRALKRSQTVDASVGEANGQVRRPDLLGAVVVKAAAVDTDDLPRAQERDLAFLLSLIQAPERYPVTTGDRRQLRQRIDLLDPAHEAYDGLTQDRALTARRALNAFTF
jgi:hypothetical protein